MNIQSAHPTHRVRVRAGRVVQDVVMAEMVGQLLARYVQTVLV